MTSRRDARVCPAKRRVYCCVTLLLFYKLRFACWRHNWHAARTRAFQMIYSDGRMLRAVCDEWTNAGALSRYSPTVAEPSTYVQDCTSSNARKYNEDVHTCVLGLYVYAQSMHILYFCLYIRCSQWCYYHYTTSAATAAATAAASKAPIQPRMRVPLFMLCQTAGAVAHLGIRPAHTLHTSNIHITSKDSSIIDARWYDCCISEMWPNR